MDIEYLEEPIWYQSAITLNVVFPFLVVIFSRWIQDARVVVAVPVVASTVAAAYGIVTLVTALQTFETAGWPTRAAGIATAVVPVTMGAVVSAVMSGSIVFWPCGLSDKRTRQGTVAISLEAIGCTAWAALAWLLVRPTVPSLDGLKAAVDHVYFLRNGPDSQPRNCTGDEGAPEGHPGSEALVRPLCCAGAHSGRDSLVAKTATGARCLKPMYTWRKNCACFETS